MFLFTMPVLVFFISPSWLSWAGRLDRQSCITRQGLYRQWYAEDITATEHLSWTLDRTIHSLWISIQGYCWYYWLVKSTLLFVRPIKKY